MKRNVIWSWVLAISGVLVLLFFIINLTVQPPQRYFLDVPYSQFVAMVREGEISRVVIRDRVIEAEQMSGEVVRTLVPVSHVPEGLLGDFLDNEVTISVSSEEEGLLGLLLAWVPLVLFYVLLWLLFTRPTLKLLRKVDARLDALEDRLDRNGSTGD